MKTLTIAVIIVSNAVSGVLLAQTQAQSQPKVAAASALFPGAGRTFETFASAHSVYTEDFAKKPGFGSGRMFFLPPQDYVTVAGQTYRFSTPELVGLENEPVVYQRSGGIQEISVAIMSKAELRSSLKRRALTSVESNAVVELRAGKDLVTHKEQVPVYAFGDIEQGTAMGIRAIGALRAAENCAHCHGVPKGALLGAFSYALTPTNLVAMSAPDATRSTKPQPLRPIVNPSTMGTNQSFTMVPNLKSSLSRSIASVSAR